MAMKRHTSRIIPAALAAVLVLGACGSGDETVAPPTEQPGDGLRAPRPIELASGGSANATGALAAEDAAASDRMIAPVPWVTEYVLGDGLVLPTDDTGYVFDPASTVSIDQVSNLAEALGVTGEPVAIDDGYTTYWRVGPDDGSAPSLWVYDDAQQSWNYSSAWQEQEARVSCAAAVSSDGEVIEDDCPQPDPPVGVPTGAEAEQRVTALLEAIGVDRASVEFETFADEWSANVTVTDTADPRADLRFWNFGFGGDGVLQYAGGSLATPEAVGPYPLVDLPAAFQRLQDQTYGGFYGPAVDGPAIAIAQTNAAIAVDEPAPAPDVMESGEPGAEPIPVDPDGVVGDDATAPPVDATEPIPVDPDGGIGDGADPMPVEPTEPETVTVTLVDVQADLWWAWDVDGAAWLLPAYRFVGDDGGSYTVPAVTDEYLIQVEPQIGDPLPLDPDGVDQGGGSEPAPAPIEPTDPALADPSLLSPMIGLSLDDFTGEAKAFGYTVRVVERDGEGLDRTDDFRVDRINVAVVTVDGVEQVVRATTDDGTVIGEITIEPLIDPAADPVPLVGVFEGVSFYPACGNETLTYDGVTWYQVHRSEYPDEYASVFAVDREQPAAPQGFALRVVAPGPGDDIGTLTVWSDGVAHFVSDSGDLEAWLIDDELSYGWVC